MCLIEPYQESVISGEWVLEDVSGRMISLKLLMKFGG